MNALPSTVQTSIGRTLHLTKQIGKGGEGAIYETSEQNDIAVKLYWPNKAQSRRDKIAAMASAQFYKTNSFVAFPIEVLFAPNGVFAGFAMKRIGASKPVHMLYSPASRKVEFSRAKYNFLVRAAANIARAVASAHACGCVIGDINHSGFLISDKATSVLIDSDSFQVVAANKSYLCQVGTPEYTPPELQGARFDRVTRTPNHDNFGLAALIFQLLFMGRHPFSGRYQGSGDMPLERAIGEHRFAYSANTSATKMKPPPGAPVLTDFPLDIGQAFENAFGRAGRAKRPSATEWISLLSSLENTLVDCGSDSSHQHVTGRPCPWCRMEKSSPGFIAFAPPVVATTIPTYVDVAQLVTILKAIRDPGPTPDIQTTIVAPTTLAAPAAPSAALISTLKTRAHIGIGTSAAGAILIFLGGVATLPGLALLAAGLVANIAVPKELKQLRNARSQADVSWRSIEDAWKKQPGNSKFSQLKTEINARITALTDLPNEERRQINVLENDKRAAQLHRYLDRCLIANAKIKKIGSARKAVLASFGIETAADVNQSKVLAIQGFGPGLVAELMAWRQGLANKFVYNASEPINQSDLLALRTQLATKKAELERAIRVLATSLQQDSESSLNQRAKLTALANQAFAARKQAEANEQAATGSLHKASKFISLCCAGLAAIGLLLGSGSIISRPNEDKPVVRGRVAETPTVSPDTRSTATISVPSTPPGAPRGEASGPNSVESTVTSPLKSEALLPITPPSMQPKEVPRSPIETSETPGTAESKSAVRTPLQLQQRLIELGYMFSGADGKWGPQSKRALLEYKRQAGLKPGDALDAMTEQSLFSANAPRANCHLLFVGGWSLEPGRCGDPSQPPPVRITETRAETSGGFCIFNSIQPDGNAAWRIEASCSAGGPTHVARVRVVVNGSVLQWTSEQPEVRYYRCPASQ